MKVLVVDDDVVSRMVLMHLIDSCGQFEIVEAEDGEHAWQQLEQGLLPAICFSDLRMPRLGGMDLLKRIRASAQFRELPFILVSSATDQSTMEQASGSGASGYIVKPFQADQVRVYLAPFFAAPAAGQYQAETPAVTQQRLGINGERLLVYLAGFQSQLSGAGAEIDALLERGERDGAMVRIERLHAGCMTLGLTGLAGALKAFTAATLSGEAVHAVLADAVGMVSRQCELVRQAGTPA